MTELEQLREENTRLRAALHKRPAKGELVIDMAFSHGDWTEPYRFGYGYSLRRDIMQLNRGVLREFHSTAAELFHEHLTATFMLVGSAEQRAREIKWQVEAGTPFPPRKEITVGR